MARNASKESQVWLAELKKPHYSWKHLLGVSKKKKEFGKLKTVKSRKPLEIEKRSKLTVSCFSYFMGYTVETRAIAGQTNVETLYQV